MTGSKAALFLSAVAVLCPVRSAGAQQLDTLWSAGQLTGPESAVFGWIADAAISGDGDVFVLDAQLHELRRYDAEGTLVVRVGREGGGPGEFRSAVALGLGAKQMLYVVDRGNARVSRYSTQSGGLTLVDSFRAGGSSDICLTNEGIFVQEGAALEGGVITLYSEEGTRVRRFGAAPPVENPIARMSLSSGRIACSGREGVVLSVFDSSPVVQAFTATGELLWSDTLPDFSPVRVQEHDGGRRVSFGVDPRRGSDYVVGAIAVNDGSDFLVQIGHLSPRSERGGYTEIATYVYSVRSGERHKLNQELPQLAASSGDMFVAIDQHPFPRLTVLWYHVGR